MGGVNFLGSVGCVTRRDSHAPPARKDPIFRYATNLSYLERDVTVPGKSCSGGEDSSCGDSSCGDSCIWLGPAISRAILGPPCHLAICKYQRGTDRQSSGARPEADEYQVTFAGRAIKGSVERWSVSRMQDFNLIPQNVNEKEKQNYLKIWYMHSNVNILVTNK